MPPPALINMTVSLSHQIRIFHNKRTTPKTYKGIPQNPLVKSTCFHFCKISSASLSHRNLTEKTVPHLLSVDHPSAIRTGANPSVWADPLGSETPRIFFMHHFLCVRNQNAPLGGMLLAHIFFLSVVVYSQLLTHVICQL